MSKNNKRLIAVLTTICCISVLLMIVSLIATSTTEIAEFTPPNFDINAINDKPDIDEDSGWGKIWQEGMGYHFYFNGKLKLNDQTVDAYFYNPPENNCYLKIRVFNVQGNIIYESGLIRPGEYLKTIKFASYVSANENISIKIMSYNPENYTSMGSVILNTSIS